ncbi:MAG: GTPase HflX [Ignavibacteriales bacterium]
MRCYLIGLETRFKSVEDDLDELAALADSRGFTVVGRTSQKKAKDDPVFYVGKGKLHDIARTTEDLEVDLYIVDDETSPSQQRNMAKVLDKPVTDRTGLILDIFAERANSSEGKLQVELARSKYLLPRLIGVGADMSRLGGGIGTRGPGETKLETDRRKIRKRIRELELEIEHLIKQKDLTRRIRNQNETPLVCLVGYTNAGKSSLMAALTGSETYIDDRLFSTLDTTARRLNFASGGHVVLSDTVGFINKLPHQLVAAFRATLKEVLAADLLLHVVDVSSPGTGQRIKAVNNVLNELGVDPRCELMVYNKSDLLDPFSIDNKELDLDNGVLISAQTGQGIEQLLARMKELIYESSIELQIEVPYSRGDLLNLLYQNAMIIQREDRQDGIVLLVRAKASILGKVMNTLEDTELEH